MTVGSGQDDSDGVRVIIEGLPIESVWQLVLDNGVVDNGIRGAIDHDSNVVEHPIYKSKSVRLRNLQIVKLESVARTQMDIYRVVDRTRRQDHKVLNHRVGTFAAINAGHQHHIVLTPMIVMQWVCFSRHRAIAKIPDDVIALAMGVGRILISGTDETAVDKSYLLQAVNGVAQAVAKEGIGETVGRTAVHVETTVCRVGTHETEMAIAVDGAVDGKSTFGRDKAVGRRIMPGIVEAKRGGKAVDIVATVVGDELFAPAGEIKVGIAVVGALAAVVSGELQVNATAVKWCQVDAHKSPVFPQHMAIDIPAQSGIGNKVGGIAVGVDVDPMLILESEGESGLGGSVVEWVFKHGGIFHS